MGRRGGSGGRSRHRRHRGADLHVRPAVREAVGEEPGAAGIGGRCGWVGATSRRRGGRCSRSATALEHGQPAAAAVAIERSFGARRFSHNLDGAVHQRLHRRLPRGRDRSRRRRPWRRCGRSGTGRRTRWRPIRAPGRRGGRRFPKRCSTTASPERWTATGTGRSRGPEPGPGGPVGFPEEASEEPPARLVHHLPAQPVPKGHTHSRQPASPHPRGRGGENLRVDAEPRPPRRAPHGPHHGGDGLAQRGRAARVAARRGAPPPAPPPPVSAGLQSRRRYRRALPGRGRR